MPRLSIQLSDELDERLNGFLPWGVKQRVMESMCVMLCDAVDIHGPKLVGLLINQEFNLITQEVKKEAQSAS